MASRHDVRILPHGRIVSVAAGESVLAAALRAGLNLPHSCKSGHCGSCRARLLSGDATDAHGVRPLGLSEEEARNGYVLLCQTRAMSDLTVEARAVTRAAEAEIKTLPCRIEALERLASDVMQVMLRLPAVEPLHFTAGQYLDVLLEDGRRRSFSIACPPHDSDRIELHVRLAPGGRFTGKLFTQLRTGALLRVEGPLGQFAYRDDDRPLIFIAGGTGFAPIKAIVRHVLERGLQRTMRLYWGARAAAELYQHALLEEWAARYPQLSYVPVISHAPEGTDGFRRGWVHSAVLADRPDLAQHEVYAAGPPAMIEAIRAEFPAHGLAPEDLHFDSFDYAPDSGPARASGWLTASG